jgi:hypothetical protein
VKGPTGLAVQSITSADAAVVLVAVVEHLDAVASLLECPRALGLNSYTPELTNITVKQLLFANRRMVTATVLQPEMDLLKAGRTEEATSKADRYSVELL